MALDIDGTIGRYHEHFKAFAEPYTGRDLPLDWNPEFRGRFNRALHLSKNLYRECKLAYRQGGMKRSMPVFENASHLTRSIRRKGAQVWICTTRPYLRLDNIDPDTRHFLKRQKIQFDGVLYGEKKYRDLVHIVGRHRVVAVLDDLPEQIEAANKLGLPTILRSGDHNKWHEFWDDGSEQKIAMDLFQAEEMILQQIKEWKSGR